MTERGTFRGYRRPDGQVGVRNSVAVIPSCGCALHAARQIASSVEGAQLLDYNEGCGETEKDTELALTLLAQYGRHPNVIGSIVVSLGCETLDATELADRIEQGWAPVELFVIQDLGGTANAIAAGRKSASRMLIAAQNLEREPCPISALQIGLECGGSDATSGMTANPAMGVCSDQLVARGGSVILAETSELLGAEHILAQRASSDAIRQRFLRTIESCESYLKATGEDFMGKQPSPGNVRGGITTVEEKALGDALKAGTSPIVDVLGYGEPPNKPGLSFMDTPGNDLASVTGLAAAGVQLVLFSTGRGNPMGNAIAPVIKVTGNHATYRRMSADIDIDASTIIHNGVTAEEVGQDIYRFVLQVAEGKPTAAERLGHSEFMMLRKGPIY